MKRQTALKLTAADNLRLGTIDEVIPEPIGGAHRNLPQTAEAIKVAFLRVLPELCRLSTEELLEQRYAKFRRIGRPS